MRSVITALMTSLSLAALAVPAQACDMKKCAHAKTPGATCEKCHQKHESCEKGEGCKSCEKCDGKAADAAPAEGAQGK